MDKNNTPGIDGQEFKITVHKNWFFQEINITMATDREYKYGDIIDMYNESILQDKKPLLDLATNKLKLDLEFTGNQIVRKSKYQIVNWFRKLFNCEKKYREIKWKYTIPYEKD